MDGRKKSVSSKEYERVRKRQEKVNYPWEWLSYPEPVARFTAWIAVFTFCLLLASFAQWRAIRGQLDAMQADQRAWLKISASPVSISFDRASGSAITQYRLRIENVGKSVAIGAHIEAKAIVLPSSANPLQNLMPAQEYFCAESISNKATEYRERNNEGVILFPGEHYPPDNMQFGGNTTISGKEIRNSFPIVEGRELDFFTEYLIGCVTYRLNLTNERHQTGFIYTIIRTDATKSPGVPLMLKPGGDLVPPDLAFDPWLFGSGKID